jgi:hypothetical protein
MLCGARRFDEGLRWYQEVLDRDPRHAWALPSVLYYRWLHLHDAAAAKKLRALAKADPTNGRAAQLVARLDEEGGAETVRAKTSAKIKPTARASQTKAAPPKRGGTKKKASPKKTTAKKPGAKKKATPAKATAKKKKKKKPTSKSSATKKKPASQSGGTNKRAAPKGGAKKKAASKVGAKKKKASKSAKR